MVAPKSEKNKLTVDGDYIYDMRLNFSNEEMINSLPFRLENQKAEDGTSALSDGTYYLHTILQLNQKHFQEKDKLPLSLVITGQGGSGKNYVIRALQNLISDTCIVTSYFGIAAFNIAGVTLHGLFRLPINGQNACDLKGITLAITRQIKGD